MQAEEGAPVLILLHAARRDRFVNFLQIAINQALNEIDQPGCPPERQLVQRILVVELLTIVDLFAPDWDSQVTVPGEDSDESSQSESSNAHNGM